MNTIKEIAQAIDGRQYGSETTPEIIKAAKDIRAVIVFGASDDLMELNGAIYDEVGCFDGGFAYITPEGLFEECECVCKYSEAAKAKAYKLNAIWGDTGWSYTIPLPYEIFNILSDGRQYCRGIVFQLPNS